MGKSKKLMGVQQILLHPDKEVQAILEYLCSESNKLHNCATYYARQVYFKTRKYVTGFDLINEMRSSQNRHFQAFNSDAAAQTCLSVGESIKSFSELLKLWFQGKLEDKPKFPKYRDKGFHVVSFPARRLRLADGAIKFPLGVQIKAWFGIKDFSLPMPTNLVFSQLKEVRILPRNGCFYAEFVYPVATIQANVDPSKVLGIDPGLNNWVAGVTNVGTSFVVDGRHVKSVNQWYNKTVAKLKTDKPQGFWSKRLARMTEKRNRQMRDAVNKAAKVILNHCLENDIGTVVFGWNKGQKDSINLGKSNNQKFVQIPTARLKGRVEQLCVKHGIRFVETEESYTSKASFLDSDELPTFGEKPEGWKASGKRVKRGLYKTAQGWFVNADCNGAANIIKKVAVKLGLDLSRTSRGDLTAPLKIRFWSIQESPSL